MSFEAVGGLDTYSLETLDYRAAGASLLKKKILSPRARSHVSMLVGEVWNVKRYKF